MTSRGAKGQRESPESVCVCVWAVGCFACAKVTCGRPEIITASSLVPSVSPPACCHTCRYLSLSLNGFPRFFMTAQPLFMSRGPITKTVNAGPKLGSLCISRHVLIKREGSQHSQCCAGFNHMGTKRMGESSELADEGVNYEYIPEIY